MVNRRTRIKQGQNVETNEYPWMAGIVTIFAPTKVFCGGAIISKKHIITAHHCVAWSVITKKKH